MKKFIYTITAFVAFTYSVNAQVGIETDQISEKAILDFPDTNVDGGILLPYVEDPAATAGNTGGTILYNAGDGRIYQRGEGSTGWVPLTPDLVDPNNKVSHDTTVFPELSANGVSISNAGETTAEGVLVLKSNDRALALPKVPNIDNIHSPKPGMICYDVSRRALAIFNGETWILRN